MSSLLTSSRASPRRESLDVFLLGLVDFESCVALQEIILQEIRNRDDRHGVLLVCEHLPLLTIGREGSHAHLSCEGGGAGFAANRDAVDQSGGRVSGACAGSDRLLSDFAAESNGPGSGGIPSGSGGDRVADGAGITDPGGAFGRDAGDSGSDGAIRFCRYGGEIVGELPRDVFERPTSAGLDATGTDESVGSSGDESGSGADASDRDARRPRGDDSPFRITGRLRPLSFVYGASITSFDSQKAGPCWKSLNFHRSLRNVDCLRG